MANTTFIPASSITYSDGARYTWAQVERACFGGYGVDYCKDANGLYWKALCDAAGYVVAWTAAGAMEILANAVN